MAASCPAGLRPQAFALYRLAINLGMGVGPAVGGFLAEIDFALLFPVDGCVCILSAVLLLGWTRGQGQSQKPTPAAEPSAPGAGAEALGTSPWGDRLFLLIAGNTFLMALISFQWLYAGPLFLAADYQFTESQIGLVLAINPVLIVLLEMVLVRKLRGKAPLPWIALSGLILACGIGLLPFGSGLGWVIMVVVLWTIAEMLESPLSSAFAANRAGDSHIGRYMGVYTLSFSLAQMFAPVLGLSIYHSYGSDVLWFGCAAIGLLSAGVVFVMSRR